MTASKLVKAMEAIQEGIEKGNLLIVSDGFFQLTGKRINPPQPKDPLEEAVEIFSALGVTSTTEEEESKESEAESFVMNPTRQSKKSRRTQRDEPWENTFDPDTIPDKEDPALEGIDDSKPRKKSKRPPHKTASKTCSECGNDFKIDGSNSHESRCHNCLISKTRR